MPFTINDSLKTPTSLLDYVSDDATFTFSNQGTLIKKINGGSYSNGGAITQFGVQGQAGLRFQIEVKKVGAGSPFAPFNIQPSKVLSEVGGYGFSFGTGAGGAQTLETTGPAGGRVIFNTAVTDNTFYRFRLFFLTDSSIEYSVNGNVVDVVENIENQGGKWWFSLNTSFYNAVGLDYKNLQIRQF